MSDGVKSALIAGVLGVLTAALTLFVSYRMNPPPCDVQIHTPAEQTFSANTSTNVEVHYSFSERCAVVVPQVSQFRLESNGATTPLTEDSLIDSKCRTNEPLAFALKNIDWSDSTTVANYRKYHKVRFAFCPNTTGQPRVVHAVIGGSARITFTQVP